MTDGQTPRRSANSNNTTKNTVWYGTMVLTVNKQAKQKATLVVWTMAEKIKIYIVTLEHDNGTRVTVDGYEIDEDVVKDYFVAGDDIVRLKDYIIRDIIKGNRSRGQVCLYTPPPAASTGDLLWQPCNPEDDLVDK